MLFKRIRNLREDFDLTQKEICKYLCCSQQVYSDYENGKVLPPIDIIIKLSHYYNVTTDYLLGLSNKRK